MTGISLKNNKDETTDVRSYNEGNSDYWEHKYQCWDFWIKFKLNPFDADITKRTLRTKQTDPRILDYKKIKHICLERIRQFKENINVFPIEKIDIPIDDMLEDYDITSDDILIVLRTIYPKIDNRVEDYECIIKLCEKRIKELEK